jgi:hypothetical protein
MWSTQHYRVDRRGEVTERGEPRGTVSKLAAGWQAVGIDGLCDEVAYRTRQSAARSLLRGCLYGIHDGVCACR